jgi:hypothetical protein
MVEKKNENEREDCRPGRKKRKREKGYGKRRDGTGRERERERVINGRERVWVVHLMQNDGKEMGFSVVGILWLLVRQFVSYSFLIIKFRKFDYFIIVNHLFLYYIKIG